MNSNLKKRKIEGNLKNVFLNTYIYSLLLFFIIYLTNKKKENLMIQQINFNKKNIFLYYKITNWAITTQFF
jgi:hypothetical protein